MWPYEEYTILENILVVAIPYLFVLVLYYLLQPRLSKRVSERQSKM